MSEGIEMFYPSGEMAVREIVPGFHGRFFHGQMLTLARWTVKQGSQLPAHSHLHEQVTSVITGEFQMTIEGQTQTLRAGDTAVIPADSVHSGIALTDCELVDAFSPVRDDYR